jgi:hypothetical protein
MTIYRLLTHCADMLINQSMSNLAEGGASPAAQASRFFVNRIWMPSQP